MKGNKAELPTRAEIEICLRGVPPDEELIRSTRQFCRLIGDSLDDVWRWTVSIDAVSTLTSRRYRSRIRLETARGKLEASGSGSDPQIAAQRGLAAMFISLMCAEGEVLANQATGVA